MRLLQAAAMAAVLAVGADNCFAQGSYLAPSVLPMPLPSVQGGAYTSWPVAQSTLVAPPQSTIDGLAAGTILSAPAPYRYEPWIAGDAAVDSNCGGNGCNYCPSCGCCSYAGVAGLYMTRDRANGYWTTFDTNNLSNQLMSTEDASAGWTGGFEVTLGRQIGCQCALQSTFWWLSNMHGSSSITSDINAISTPINVGLVTINGNPASDYTDNARQHRLTRSDEVLNLELNLITARMYGDCRFHLSWDFGVRYFRFADNLEFASLSGAAAPGIVIGQDPSNEAYLNINTLNNLVGFQLGAEADYYLFPRLRVYALPMVGIFGNEMSVRTRLTDGNGVNGLASPSGGTPEFFPINGHKIDASILAQLDLGLSYQITPCWRAYAGYRAVAISGVALADSQFQPFLTDAQGFRDIDANGSLIIHGLVVGLEWGY